MTTPRKSPIVVGLGGLLTSGKDAFADALVSRCDLRGYEFVKVGMSDPLWNALLTLDPVIPVEIDANTPFVGQTFVHYLRLSALAEHNDYVTLKKNPEVRRLLQFLGTEVGRKLIDENVWVKAARRMIDQHLQAGRSVALTGVRFPNEVDLITGYGSYGLSVWVERLGLTDTGTHASENSIGPSDFNLIVENHGTLGDLAEIAVELMEVNGIEDLRAGTHWRLN